MNSLRQSRISSCLSLTSQRQNNIKQFQFEFTKRKETSRHTWWCVSVKRCCCKNPPRSPRSDLLIGSSLLCDSHFPRLCVLWPRWLATVALLILSVPSKPWPEPEPGRLRITTVSWAATPAPARSRLWPSTGSGPRKVTPTRWGKRRTSRCAFFRKASFGDFKPLFLFISSRYKKLKKLCWIGRKELYTTSGRARVLTFPSNSL